MGKNDAVGQLKPVGCNYPGCQKRFDTEKEMKRHKVQDTTHFYCKKCDVDCQDDEELKLHKIAAMAPWLEGDMKASDGSPKHIVCEFCGMDFKSFGGRKIHREQRHPADQHIECPGCDAIFVRAGHLLAHLQHGKCRDITSRQFLNSVQHKHVNNEMSGHFHDIQNNLLMYQGSRDTKLMIGQCAEDVEEGGVSLLDNEDAHQKHGMLPLQAVVPLLGNATPPRLTEGALKKWPRLPSQNQDDLTGSLRKMSMSSSTMSAGSGGVSIDDSQPMESASQITSRRKGRKAYTESWPSINSPNHPLSTTSDDDIASEVTTAQASSINPSGAWMTGSASQVLYKGAKPTPPRAGGWNELLHSREEEALTGNRESLLTVRFWDPNSADFDKDRFLCWNEALEKYEYRCPFAGCEDASYDVDVDLIGHLHYAHLKIHYTCPLCLKRFTSGHALIAHSESAGKCRVKKSTKYDKLLDEVSGGFLRAEHLREPRIAKKKGAEERKGLMSTRFIAQIPGEKEDESSSSSEDEGQSQYGNIRAIKAGRP